MQIILIKRVIIMAKKEERKDSNEVYVGRRVDREGNEMRGDISYIQEIKRKLEQFKDVQLFASIGTLHRMANLAKYFQDEGNITYVPKMRKNKETGNEYIVTDYMCIINQVKPVVQKTK
jgi:hypothetical protein